MDPAFQWVVVLDGRGQTLVTVYSERYTKRRKLEEQTKERLGALDTVFLEATAQAEKWYGKTNFILIAYKKAKILLTYSGVHDVYLAVRVSPSALAEHLFPKVELALKRSKRKLGAGSRP